MNQSIYIKCENCRFSRSTLIMLIATASMVTAFAYFLNSSLFISELVSYYFYVPCSFIVIFSLYFLYRERNVDYIYLNEEEVWFKEKNQNETVCLKFESLNYFETRFSEIIFITAEEQKMIMALNAIGDKKKRWEIKEFLRNHITQLRENQSALASAS